MALPDSAKIVWQTPKVFADSTYAPGDASQPDTIDAQILLDSLPAASSQCRQSVKLNLGSANADLIGRMRAYIEFFAAPTAGGAVNFYLGWSDSAVAGENNPAGLDGTDSLFQGYGADAPSGTEALLQLDYIGTLTVTNDIAIQVSPYFYFVPRDQYAILVVENRTSVDLSATDAIETGVAIWLGEHRVVD